MPEEEFDFTQESQYNDNNPGHSEHTTNIQDTNREKIQEVTQVNEVVSENPTCPNC